MFAAKVTLNLSKDITSYALSRFDTSWIQVPDVSHEKLLYTTPYLAKNNHHQYNRCHHHHHHYHHLNNVIVVIAIVF